jgi:hypothetical protein
LKIDGYYSEFFRIGKETKEKVMMFICNDIESYHNIKKEEKWHQAYIEQLPKSWCGGGFVMHNAESIQAMKDLRDAIIATPDKIFLHIGMKATTTANYQFYTFETATTSFAIGTATIEAGSVVGDFPRDGEWYGFDIPMAQFVSEISAVTIKDNGHYILSFLGGNNPGSQLNLDAVYFYEKE